MCRVVGMMMNGGMSNGYDQPEFNEAAFLAGRIPVVNDPANVPRAMRGSFYEGISKSP